MNPKAKKAFIIFVSISMFLMSLFAVLAFTNILYEIWYLVGAVIVVISIDTILFFWFLRVKTKEQEELQGEVYQ